MSKLILADNMSVFRTGTAKVLSGEDDIRVIAQCPDAMHLHRAVATFPGVAVLFASSLEQDPLQIMQQVRSFGSRGIAMLENNESPEPYLAAQVHGLLFRSITSKALVDCVRRVGRGERTLHFAAHTEARQVEDLVGSRVRDRLTPREMKIVALVMQGCKNKEIGTRLDTTEHVIKNSLRLIYNKTGVYDRLELAMFTLHHRALALAVETASVLVPQAA